MPNEYSKNPNQVKIKVIGIGGGGGNAVNHMVNTCGKEVEFININTDTQILIKALAPTKLPIGERITKGHGAGGNPELGEKAAEESIDEITNLLKGTDMVFITAGMGGGTGTGAAPIIAKVAKSLDILTVAVVTKPFSFEGARRMSFAEAGIEKLREYTDSLIVIPNERLKLITDKRITFLNAFQEADDVLRKGVQSIVELITIEGMINLDFADITAVMKSAGLAHMGIGSAKGKDKAEQAAKMAMSSPLLETNISGAKGIIICISGAPDIGLDEIDAAVTMITDEAQADATIIFGVALDAALEDEMKITLIATGFDSDKRSFDKKRQQPLGGSYQQPANSGAKKDGEDDLMDIINLLNRN